MTYKTRLGLRRDTRRKVTSTMSTIGIPVKLLHESMGHIVTVEVKGGQVYRGKLHDGERMECSYIVMLILSRG